MISSKNKGFALAGTTVALLATGIVTQSLNASEATMVECVGVKDKNGCPAKKDKNGCPAKKEKGDHWAIMTKQACIKAGGRPVKINKRSE